MSKIKVLDLARDAGMEDDKYLLKLKRMGVKVKDKKTEEPEKAASTSDEKIIERDADKEVVEKRVKPTVIRRRTRTLETKVEAQSVEAPSAVEPAPPLAPPQGAAAEPVSPEEKPLTVPEREAEPKEKVSVKAPERVEGEKQAPTPAKPVRGRKKGDEEIETPLTGEVKGEAKEVRPVKGVEAQRPASAAAKEGKPREEARKEGVEVKPKVAVLPKEELRVPKKLVEEEVPPAAKKKAFAKKRRVIEERMLVEEHEEEEPLEKGKEEELPPVARPFRPMKKKVVIKATPKKTEVTVPKPIKRIIRIAEVITVGDLAKRMGVKGGELIKKLMDIGVLVNINQMIDADVASLVANEFGYEVEKTSLEHQDLLERKEDQPEQLKGRSPVVTVMGHVDHGKTMLLDAIRKTNVVEGEAGGITQHIGAYNVELDNGRVVFIDTPGHEAFTAMRARGAQVTDVVILVVAADDGVMPQTKEAIDHARAAKVPIVVAINKIDKPAANPEKVRKELADLGLLPEKWGGNTLFAEVSAKQKTGIKELLELILLQAEVLELKVNPDKSARGVIIEAKLDKGRGPVATVLVQEGTLKTGDPFLAGSHHGRVRAMLNDKGQKIEETGPSTPVEVVGFADVPEAGETFIVVPEERMAKQISLYRQEKMRAKELAKLSKVSLEELYDQIKKGEVKELNVIIKADVQGSIEAMKEALNRLSTDAVKVNILHDAVGGITETDVNLASASNAIIIGFNVRAVLKAQTLAEQEKVDVRSYSIIYDAISDIRKALEGLLEPTYKEHLLGRAQVVQVFNIRKVGTIAGSLILDGKVVRGSHARLLRDNVVVYDGRIVSLRRFKDDVKDCAEGLECGIAIENYSDVKQGDIVESYEVEEIRTRLS
jgi:translation initiation factor IF-2